MALEKTQKDAVTTRLDLIFWTRSYKKDDEPLLNLTGGYEKLLKREGTFVYTKEGTRVPL